MSSPPLIEATQLSRSFGPICAVRAVSFGLRRGEVMGFLGPNGAGKTTTLQMVSGCLAPSAGRVRLDGIDLQEQPLAAKRRLGYLPERPPLYPELDVTTYLRFCARLRGVGRRQLVPAVERAVERCGVGGFRHRVIGSLSKGQQQRVGIAQAVVHEPAALVLDEPTVGLDPHQLMAIRGLIRELAAGCGVVVSSHLLPEVAATCDRVLILHRGRIVHDARLDETQAEQVWLRLGLRRPPSDVAALVVPGVVEVRAGDGPGRYRLRCQHGSDPAPRLAALAADRQWELDELYQEEAGLEQVFVAVTTGDAAENE